MEKNQGVGKVLRIIVIREPVCVLLEVHLPRNLIDGANGRALLLWNREGGTGFLLHKIKSIWQGQVQQAIYEPQLYGKHALGNY
jgi:hypothetical protein